MATAKTRNIYKRSYYRNVQIVDCTTVQLFGNHGNYNYDLI